MSKKPFDALAFMFCFFWALLAVIQEATDESKATPKEALMLAVVITVTSYWFSKLFR